MKQKYINIFKQILKIEDEKVLDEARINDIINWNSFNHLRLIAEIERQFDVKFTPKNILEFQSFQSGIEILSDKGINF